MAQQQRRIFRRRRYAPNRKWSEQEQKNLIKFLMENKPFEAPNGELYYKKFLTEQNLNIEWRLVRYKVRNLRVSYMRANDWIIRNANGVLRETKKPKDLLYSIYPLYDDLQRLFGELVPSEKSIIEEISVESKAEVNNIEQEDSNAISFNNAVEPFTINGIYSRMDLSDPLQVQAFFEEDIKPVISSINGWTDKSQESNQSFTHFSDAPLVPAERVFQKNMTAATANLNFANRVNASTTQNSFKPTNVTKATQTHASMEDLQRLRLQVEIQTMKDELLLKKRDFEFRQEQWKFEKERQIQEFQLKNAELKSNEKFRILELKFEKWKYKQELAFKKSMT